MRHAYSLPVLRTLGAPLLCGLVFLASAGAQSASGDLSQVSLEDLMNIPVTSVSRRQQPMSKVAAAVFVITQEEIARSGARNIPDLLRMVPGLDVAQLSANAWAISSRGFNDQFAAKLLVLIDGRSVYDPTFSGVYWDQQDVPLIDIERIEVIRGPGAAVWGANAVNGVINIITKSAKTTQGGVVSAGSGSEDAHAVIEYGGKIGRKGTYRVFSGYDSYNNLVEPSEGPGDQLAADGWHLTHGGFRSDWNLSGRDALTVEGDILSGGEGQTINSFVSLAPPIVRTFNDPVRPGGGSIMGRWTHSFSGRSDTALQVYYDGVNRTDLGVRQLWHTFDVDFQHHLLPGSRQDLVWGAEYRSTTDNILPGYAVSMNPPRRAVNLSSAFLQDEFTLADSLRLTLGSKFEQNSYTGFEGEPDARLLWSPTPQQAVWLAVSRAIRQPSRADSNVHYNVAAFPGPDGLNTLVTLFGNPDFQSEDLVAYEAGYRAQPASRVSLDFASFYNVYHHLRTNEPGTPTFELSPPPPHMLLPRLFGNKMHGHTYGVEVSADWSVIDRWKVTGSYSWLKMNLHFDPGSRDTTSVLAATSQNPHHQFQIRSYLSLPRRVDFDTALYYVNRLPAFNVPSYTRVDARLAWNASESIVLSVVGQNLFDDHHLEFGGIDRIDATEAKRSVYGEVTWRF